MPFLAAVIPAVVEGAVTSAVATGVGVGASALVSRLAAPPGATQPPPDVFDILNDDSNTSNFP
jgi:hypothetical protein